MVYRTPVIQHTASQIQNNCTQALQRIEEQTVPVKTSSAPSSKIPQKEVKVPNCIKTREKSNSSSEEEDGEPEPEENGFHKKETVAKTCVIDEDYDT